ncbi:MAG: patatin-like phospholipase family protein [Thermodesulfobacteriota bacterium]|nr:patatin-like phospholipase family protein [Thermodesulfobacteriota bacterium]
MRQHKKIGLALGGGGARGLAHIGAVKVLEREGINPDIIVGTSMGSLVGGALATGLKAEELEKQLFSFLETDLYKSSELRVVGDAERGNEQSLSRRIQSYFKTKIRLVHGIYRPGILETKDIEESINYFIPDINIEETIIPFRSVATDLKSGKPVVLREGSLRRAILASSSVPGMLPYVEIDGKRLSDGGIIQSVPARSAAEEGANVVIAIAVDKDLDFVPDFHTAMDIYVRAAEIQGYYLVRHELKCADIVIRPKLGSVHWTDFSNAQDLILSGESAAMDMVSDIRVVVKKASKKGFFGRVTKKIKGLFVMEKPENG